MPLRIALAGFLGVAAVLLLGAGFAFAYIDFAPPGEGADEGEESPAPEPEGDAEGLLVTEETAGCFLLSALSGLCALLLALSSLGSREPHLLQRIEDLVPVFSRTPDPRGAEATSGNGQHAPNPTLHQLMRELSNPHPSVRLVAIRDLREMGPDAEPALGSLTAMLRDCDGDLALLQPIVLTLMAISAERESIVTELTRRLKSSNPAVRNWSALMLGRIGPRAADAVDQLHRVLDDPSVVESAVEALRNIGGEEALAVLRRWKSLDPPDHRD